MKKGLINIIILILLITNIVLTAIMVFSIVPAMNASNKLITKVAEAIDLQQDASKEQGNLSIEDMDNFVMEQKITANLRTGADNKSHYVVVKVILTLDKSDDGYAKYRPKIESYEELITSKVIDIISGYTNDNITDYKQDILKEICLELREFFNNSKFIHSVSFSEFIIS